MRRLTLTLAGAAVAGLLSVTGLVASAQADGFRPEAVRHEDRNRWREHLFFDFRFLDRRHDHDHDRDYDRDRRW